MRPRHRDIGWHCELGNACLGESFDLRRFHNAVIDNGGLSLQVLEQPTPD